MAGHYTIKLDEKQYQTLINALPDRRPAPGPFSRRQEEQWNLRDDLLRVKKDKDG